MTASKWKKKRAKDTAKLRRPKTPNGWLTRWRKNVAAIREKIDVLWTDRANYKEYREIVTANPRLDKKAGFFHLVDRMYLSHVLVAIRTFDDTDLRSNSLYNLIEEVRDNAGQFTKAWFINRFAKRSVGQWQFRKHWNGKAHISKRRVNADLNSLVALCRRVRQVTNKYLAHSARRKPSKRLSYGEIDVAIDGIHKLMSRYYTLIFNTGYEPPLILPSCHVFKMAWSTDIDS